MGKTKKYTRFGATNKFGHDVSTIEEAFIKEYGKDYKLPIKTLDLLDRVKSPQRQRGWILTMLHVSGNEDITRMRCNLNWETYLKHGGKLIMKKALETDNYEYLISKFYEFERINYNKLDALFEERYGKDYDGHGLVLPIGIFKNKRESDKFLKSISYSKMDISKLGDTICHGIGGFGMFNPPIECLKDNDYGDEVMNKIMLGAKFGKEKAAEHFQARKDFMKERTRRDLAKKGKQQKNKMKNNQFEKYSEKEFDEIFTSFFDPEDQIKLKIGRDEEAFERVKEVINLEKNIDKDLAFNITPEAKALLKGKRADYKPIEDDLETINKKRINKNGSSSKENKSS